MLQEKGNELAREVCVLILPQCDTDHCASQALLLCRTWVLSDWLSAVLRMGHGSEGRALQLLHTIPLLLLR